MRFVSLFTWFYTSEVVVWDFFHQQYGVRTSKDRNAVFSCGIDFCQMFWQEFTSQADKTDSILKKALASQILAKGIRGMRSWDMRLA